MSRYTRILKKASLIATLVFPAVSGSANFPAVIEVAELDGNNGFALTGVAEGDKSGTSVSTTGDLNSDGIDDLVIGAPFADVDNGDVTLVDAGTSYVLFGGANVNNTFSTVFLSGFLDGVRGFAIDGVAAGGHSGSSVSFAGDINVDGKDDLVIGAPGSGAGSSFVLFGDANVNNTFQSIFLSGFMDGVRGFAISGVAAGDHSGASVSFAGDINEDGKDDLLIGAPVASPNSEVSNSGGSYVLFGDANVNMTFSTIFLEGFMDGERGFAIAGVAENDRSGHSVSFAGDINNDGRDDLLIGAPDAAYTFLLGSPGESYILFGDSGVNNTFATIFLSGFMDGARGFALQGVVPGDRSGSSVSTVGDLNGDGIDDIVVGTPNVATNGTNSGAIYVLFGGENANQGFSTLFLSGLDGTTGFKMNGNGAGDLFGSSVSFAGDINDDGIDDLVIGAPGANAEGIDAGTGACYILFGDTNVNLGYSDLFLSVLDGQKGFKINGNAAGDRFGASVSTAGDINHDGVDDLIIGAPDADSDAVDSGKSYVLFGKSGRIFKDGFE